MRTSPLPNRIWYKGPRAALLHLGIWPPLDCQKTSFAGRLPLLRGKLICSESNLYGFRASYWQGTSKFGLGPEIQRG